MTQTPELKNCPFCGKRPSGETSVYEADDIGGWLAGCFCAQTWGDTEAEAIAAWNTRPLEADNAALKAKNEALVEAASTLATEAVLLLNNAEGCAISHYGHDGELFGFPQWLADSRAKIQSARAALAGAQ